MLSWPWRGQLTEWHSLPWLENWMHWNWERHSWVWLRTGSTGNGNGTHGRDWGTGSTGTEICSSNITLVRAWNELDCTLRKAMNEWMSEWMMHLYNALLCIVVHPKHFTFIWGDVGSLLNHHQCVESIWMMCRLPQDNGATALTTHQLQVERRETHRANQVYALTTHQLQVERRASHRDNQVDEDYYEAIIDKDQWWEFGQDTGVTPLLFTRSAMQFLMTTESQDLGLTSQPERRCFLTELYPVTILGR